MASSENIFDSYHTFATSSQSLSGPFSYGDVDIQVGSSFEDNYNINGGNSAGPSSQFNMQPPMHRPLQFQIPQFVMPGSQLVVGGGAEVISPMVFSAMQQQAGTYTPSWFSHATNTNTNSFRKEKFTNENSWSWSLPLESPMSLQMPKSAFNKRPTLTEIDTQISPTHQIATSAPLLPTQIPQVSNPPAQGLPVYSSTGFDLLPLLARIASRPNPSVLLGPVDCTCSFLVTSIRHYDSPIVYASPNFCALSGYSEQEILGQNCRFLQDRCGLSRKDNSEYPSNNELYQLKKAIEANKECQYIVMNFKKDGTPFFNFLTVIPVAADNSSDEIAYHFGFQVDLRAQPGVLAKRLEGILNSSSSVPMPRRCDEYISIDPTLKQAKKNHKLSPDLHDFLANYCCTLEAGDISTEDTVENTDVNILNHFLLSHGSDFIHVLSLKGTFLYVSPSVRNVLGYEATELINASITDLCHEQDVIPIMRELKDSSTVSVAGLMNDARRPPRPVNLLFRIRAKDGNFVWLDCAGRLYLEPSKSRKAIVLSGRVRTIPRLTWDVVARSGGITLPIPISCSAPTPVDSEQGQSSESASSIQTSTQEGEFWAMLSSKGVFLVASDGVRDVLGWGSAEIIGRSVSELVGENNSTAADQKPNSIHQLLNDVLEKLTAEHVESTLFPCKMKRRDGELIDVVITIYCISTSNPSSLLYPFDGYRKFEPHLPYQSQFLGYQPTSSLLDSIPSPFICQFKIYYSNTGRAAIPGHIEHQLYSNIFEELDVERDSSWQYELQQLKLDNRRLMEEVNSLETQFVHQQNLASAGISQTQNQSQNQSQNHDTTPFSNREPFSYISTSNSQPTSLQSPIDQYTGSTEVLSSYNQSADISSSMYHQSAVLGKRSWDER